MENEQLTLVTKDLDLESASALRGAFESMFGQAEEWIARAKGIVVTSEDQKREMKLARESRLALREIRVNAEKTRKQLKENALRTGKAIDGIANVIKGLIEPIEAYLEEQETFAERAEKKRQDALRAARASALSALGIDPVIFASTLSALGVNPTAYADLAAMQDEAWASLLEQAKRVNADRKEAARREQEARLEAERAAAALREKQREAEAERARREKKLAAENARLRAETQALERARQAQEAAAREAKRILTAERERIARETRERDEADRMQREARAHASLRLDHEKLHELATELRNIEMPTMSTPRGKQVLIEIAKNFACLLSQIEEAAEEAADWGAAETRASSADRAKPRRRRTNAR